MTASGKFSCLRAEKTSMKDLRYKFQEKWVIEARKSSIWTTTVSSCRSLQCTYLMQSSILEKPSICTWSELSSMSCRLLLATMNISLRCTPLTHPQNKWSRATLYRPTSFTAAKITLRLASNSISTPTDILLWFGRHFWRAAKISLCSSFLRMVSTWQFS